MTCTTCGQRCGSPRSSPLFGVLPSPSGVNPTDVVRLSVKRVGARVDDTAGPTAGPTAAPTTPPTNGASQPAQPDLASIWRLLVEDLPPSQRAWLAASRPVTLHENTAIIAVADDFTRNQLEGRLRTRLEASPRHTCCTRSVTTCAACSTAPGFGTCRARSSPMSSSTRFVMTRRPPSSGVTVTSTYS